MNLRHFVWIGAIVGGSIGGWLPELWGAGFLSFSGIIGEMIGAVIGIFVGAKIAEW